MSEYRKLGREFAKGVIDVLAVLLIISIIISFIWGVYFQDTDNTDKNKYERSGMILYKDHGTGIEYLGTPNGGLVRRENEK